jgi:hypothetical protein
MWLQWLPWRWVIKNVARRKGFLDPIALISRLENFAQPSEVAAPTELLRSGAVLHARGLINSQAIQHNLDWVWPYWVERQFDPQDISFVPRAFSITHINLTHRNWTAVGFPDEKYLPLVDPRGLVTPFYDGWSLDGWVIPKNGAGLIPSRARQANQYFSPKENIEIITETEMEGISLACEVKMAGEAAMPHCEITYKAFSKEAATLVVSLRPYNPEGVSFIHSVAPMKEQTGWKVNDENYICFDHKPDKCLMSDYKNGDVYASLQNGKEFDQMKCSVGMATAAALYEMEANSACVVVVRVPLRQGKELTPPFELLSRSTPQWTFELKQASELQIPDKQFQFLYDTAVKTLILHSPDEVYPGPFTYKRFWFRDAAFILYALLTIGYVDRTKRVINAFLKRQTPTGYFLSQEGEWDSNGEAIWIIKKFCEMTGEKPPDSWMRAIDRGGRWISRKRVSSKTESPHAGLLPAGFSAEHLGPNDYYYWDDFWGIAGLESAAYLTEHFGNQQRSQFFSTEAKGFRECLSRSLKGVYKRLGKEIIPASPYRRMDAGAIGSLAGGYPLHVLPPDDEGLLNTINYLSENYLVKGGFFQEMTHSGINPYLTLHMAQILLRRGDKRYWDLMQAVADLASPTGQWPEAIHPHTKGGCMGDGQHVWAAAEWIIMIRNCFVREEGNRLIIGSGIPLSWLRSGQDIALGPVLTSFGRIKIKLKAENNMVTVSWQGTWLQQCPKIEVHLPFSAKQHVPENTDSIQIEIRE